MDYVRLGLVNKPNKTVKIRVAAVCLEASVWAPFGQMLHRGKTGVNE